MSLQMQFIAALAGKFSKALSTGEVAIDFDASSILQVTDGVGSGQSDIAWADERTLAASASETIDLSGALSFITSGVVSFARVKGIIVVPNTLNTTDILIGPNSSNGWLGPWNAAADRTRVRSPGFFCASRIDATAWPVTAGTADLLFVQNGGTAEASYKIAIVGASA